ncbi:hypothetical protein [Congregibacter sp.]|uniref:hypothetical protein n=1 Tax=Congregibacter sp. TaxID=2744308 RepID=UPI003F6D4ABC
MRKTDKKLERGLVNTLTRICDEALEEIPGFAWLTHFVDYNNFPESLRIVCVFETDEQLEAVRAAQKDARLSARVIEGLKSVGVSISPRGRQIQFDTEEACARENSGNWQARYGSTKS